MNLFSIISIYKIMGLTQSSSQNTKDFTKLRSRHLSKEEIRRNIKVLLSNKNLPHFTDNNETLNWITESINLSESMKGGSVTSDSENLKKLNNFIKSLESESSENNFGAYKDEVKDLENYINQNGGFEKFEGRPLNIVYSKYLEQLGGAANETENNESSDDDLDLETHTPMNNDNADWNSEVKQLENYVNQNGGFDKFNGRLLNITNSNFLAKLAKNHNNVNNTETSISTINMSETIQNGGDCPCNDNSLFLRNNKSSMIGAGLNTLSATSVNSIKLRNSIKLSTTSNSSILSQRGGNIDTISATSNNNNTMIGGNNDTVSPTSVTVTQMNGGNVNTISPTSTNVTMVGGSLPNFSDTSFSENVMNGGERKEEDKRRNKKDRRRDRKETTSSESETSEDEEMELESDSDEESTDEDEEIMNDEDSQSTDDTVKMARMIATHRMLSSEKSQSESSTSESEEDSDEISDSDNSESSSSETPKKHKEQSRSKGKKAKKTTKKGGKKASKKASKKSKKSKKVISENTLSASTEFKAVPFYSSENSTDFYRTYQNRNRFN